MSGTVGVIRQQPEEVRKNDFRTRGHELRGRTSWTANRVRSGQGATRQWNICGVTGIVTSSVWCHSIMAQTTMAHASMASPLWRRSGLAHSGMARSSTAQFLCGAVSVRRIPVWRRSSTAHFSMAQFRCGASKHRPKHAVPRATCHLYHQS